MSIDVFLEQELLGVSHPGRYLGIEVNACRKAFARAEVRWALIYPDAYEIGMSNLGLSILYEIINERADAMADRAYLPWIDMQERLIAAAVPLFGLESREPLAAFDILGITLQHELTYTNVVRVLDLARGQQRLHAAPNLVPRQCAPLRDAEGVAQDVHLGDPGSVDHHLRHRHLPPPEGGDRHQAQ